MLANFLLPLVLAALTVAAAPAADNKNSPSVPSSSSYPLPAVLPVNSHHVPEIYKANSKSLPKKESSMPSFLVQPPSGLIQKSSEAGKHAPRTDAEFGSKEKSPSSNSVPTVPLPVQPSVHPMQTATEVQQHVPLRDRFVFVAKEITSTPKEDEDMSPLPTQVPEQVKATLSHAPRAVTEATKKSSEDRQPTQTQTLSLPERMAVTVDALAMHH